MKVGSTGASPGVAPAGQRAAAPSAPGFSAGPAQATPAGAAAGPAVATGVAGLEALLALQEAGGPLERRRRAVARAGRLLDGLEAVKLALLDGADGDAALQALARAASERRETAQEPALDGVLDEIETRAAVELAKREAARRAA